MRWWSNNPCLPDAANYIISCLHTGQNFDVASHLSMHPLWYLHETKRKSPISLDALQHQTPLRQ